MRKLLPPQDEGGEKFKMIYESQYYGICDLGGSLSHHGIKGQKWGVRRYQNPDGSLTEEGKRRYGTIENFERAQRRKYTAKQLAKTAAVIGATAFATHYINKRLTDNFDKKVIDFYTPKPSNTSDRKTTQSDVDRAKTYVTDMLSDKKYKSTMKTLKKGAKRYDKIMSKMLGDDYDVRLLNKNTESLLDEAIKRKRRNLSDMHIRNMTMNNLKKYDLF